MNPEMFLSTFAHTCIVTPPIYIYIYIYIYIIGVEERWCKKIHTHAYINIYVYMSVQK